MTLLDLRTEYGLSQIEAAAAVSMPVRTFIRYEKDNHYGNALKRAMMIQTLMGKYEISETKGILTIEQITNVLSGLFDGKYKGQVEFCYLFGSYAKGYAKEDSDVDLCVATQLAGLKFAGLSESIRQALHKRIDLIRFSSLENNLSLVNEIMKDGIKIYG